MIIGDAPCRKCKRHVHVELTGVSEPADDGGRRWEVLPGQKCPECENPFEWLHEPRPLSIIEHFQMSQVFSEREMVEIINPNTASIPSVSNP